MRTQTLRELFIDELRALVGTPFRHQGRVPGIGLDCVGVGVVAMRRCGLEVADHLVYERAADGETLLDRLRANGVEVSPAEVRPGDCVVVWFDRGTKAPQHVAFVTQTRPSMRVIHAWGDVGHVCECELGPMAARVVTAFRLRGLD